MKHYLKLILYPSSINLSWIEERCIPPLKRNITWHLVSIDKRGMTEVKRSVTAHSKKECRMSLHHIQTSHIFTEPYCKDKSSWEKSTHKGVALVSSEPSAYTRDYFCLNRSCCMSHKMEMWVECGSLDLHSRATREYSWHYLWSVPYVFLGNEFLSTWLNCDVTITN